MIIIDTNSLIILVLGLIDPNQKNSHRRTSIYDKKDFYFLIEKIQDLKNLIIFPNVWTELDNLLNGFSGKLKNDYINQLRFLSKTSTESFMSSNKAFELHSIYDLGLTDSIILKYASTSKCDFVITSDSTLSDHLIANGVLVIDLVKIKNNKILNIE